MDKLCESCTGRIRVIISDLMLADYAEGYGRLPPAVAKAVSDLMGLLPPAKKEDDDAE